MRMGKPTHRSGSSHIPYGASNEQINRARGPVRAGMISCRELRAPALVFVRTVFAIRLICPVRGGARSSHGHTVAEPRRCPRAMIPGRASHSLGHYPQLSHDTLQGSWRPLFGWELLADLRAEGFREAVALMCWSPDLGYLGEQVQFVARR
jgi:hypothetical protein